MSDQTLSVLLIEDNPGDARLLREYLLGATEVRFDLQAAETLTDGLKLLKQQSFHVILLDVSLPDSVGIETVLQVKTEASGAAVIVLTGWADQEFGIQAVQAGANDYLLKDETNARLLIRTIRFTIERHKVEEQLRQREEEYRSLIDDVFDTSMVAVLILDADFIVRWCNEATEVYFGVKKEDILGRDKRQLIDTDLKCIFADPDDYAARLLRAYDANDFTDRFECHVMPDEDRAERWLEHWSQPIRSGMFINGRIEQYTDITDRKYFEMAEAKQRRFAEALRDTAALLTSTLDRSEVFDRILANIERVVPHDLANISMLQGHRVMVIRRSGYKRAELRNPLAADGYILADLPIIRQMYDSQSAVILADLATQPESDRMRMIDGARAFMGVPIILYSEVIGFLNIFSRKPNTFNAEDANRLTAFAEQAAIAIQNARLYEQSHELAAVQERQRIARELHDSVSQTLFTISNMAESALRQWHINQARAEALLHDVHRLTTDALGEMRVLLLELRPDTLNRVSLRDLFEQYLRPIQKRRGLHISLQVDEVPDLNAPTKIALYRVVQEALNNIDKHAQANQVEITLTEQDDELVLTIEDNGTGFDPDAISSTSLGLGFMRERAANLGAALQIESMIGQGTRIYLQLALDRERDTSDE